VKYNDPECEKLYVQRMEFVNKHRNQSGTLGKKCTGCSTPNSPNGSGPKQAWSWHYTGFVFHEECLPNYAEKVLTPVTME